MSEIHNPLFESQKEFLERQKEEYRNALLSDVSEIKNQSQQVGKTVLMAGGALAGVWLITSMFKGKKKRKASKGLKAAPTYKTLPLNAAHISDAHIVNEDGSINYADVFHDPVVSSTGFHQPVAEEPSVVKETAKGFFQSEMGKAISQQVTAFVLIYLTKKLEEYLQEPKNADIATSTEAGVKETDFSHPQENAI
ncbi:hypothetical protein [Adhaeribacter aquaticus]|uniref:hypothetical protein n=1 Tax=Adhaeribacter aquaticus TaxID=299567 RepID=UPI00042838A3|nr:hypothetical protein [Adhaeribacter aquaticus]